MKLGRPFTIAIIALSTLTFYGGVSGNAASGDEMARGMRANGRSIYDAKGCYQCHGHSGQGSVLSGPPLAGRGLSAMAIRTYVRSPNGVMPPYRASVLDDAELEMVTAYVQSMKRGRPARDIPALRSVAPIETNRMDLIESAAPGRSTGSAAYARYCAACHGADRTGGNGPSLSAPDKRKTAAQIADIILNPPAAMPTQNLTRDEVQAIATFVANAE